MKPLILISNDDGWQAKGINFLIETLRPVARLLIVAPDGGRSGMACACTFRSPVFRQLIHEEEDLTIWSCTGTPVDCIKLACHDLCDQKPDLIIGGINHGDNSAVNVHYSGTMGVVIEGCMKGIPSVAFSLDTHDANADFTPMAPYIRAVVDYVLTKGIPQGSCLNINFPNTPSYQGVRICRMARGEWKEEFEKRLHEAEKLAAVEGVKIVALPYDHEEWLREVAAGYEHEPEKGARCERCFRYNLTKAAEYAKAHGFDEFTTSLTVSPHKVSPVIFHMGAVAAEIVTGAKWWDSMPRFICVDFKAHGGYDYSVKRAIELGLYRQSYCGCEFSKERWTIHSKRETESTNLDARAGGHRDVFTADYQTAGRGRLDHKWLSPPGINLMMSVVLSVEGLEPECVVTLPLVAGLAVTKALSSLIPHPSSLLLKWPNDVLVDGRKIAGILCERHGDSVIVGIGVNVGQVDFPPEIAEKSTSLAVLSTSNGACPLVPSVGTVRDRVLFQLGKWYGIWREKGFAAVYPGIAAIDFLKGRTLSVRQADDDLTPMTGRSNGIMPDGALDVDGTRVYAGEAHVEGI